MNENLSPRQAQLYEYLCSYIAEHNYSPTLREMREHLGLKSSAPVQEFLIRLKAKRYIWWEIGEARGVRIVGMSAARRIPIVGIVDNHGRVKYFSEE